MQKKTRVFIYIFLVALFCALLGFSESFPELKTIFIIGKVAVLAVLLFFTAKAKNMPLWILFALLVGVEFGIDFPSIAVETDRFSKIFLNLIKTIIAPLIFSTLVIGIAGHSNLKQ